MSSIVKFAAVNTKIKSLESEMLTKQQYSKLMKCENYIDALRFLKESTSYKKILKNYKIDELHRGNLEVILKDYYVDNFYKLFHYFDNNYKKLLKIFFMKYEIEDLKTILRGKFRGADKEKIYRLITSKSPLNIINYEELIASPSVEMVIENLKNTVYYKHLLGLKNSYREEGLFRIEMTLDFIYFSMLRKYIKKLDKESANIIKNINGEYCDLINIQWIFRSKKYYKLNPEEIFNYTIYDWNKVNRDMLKKLCYCNNLTEFYEKVKEFPYRELFKKSNGKEFLVEKEIMIYMKKLFLKYKSAGKMNIGSVIAYLGLYEIEIRDIISIVENKRYSQKNEDAVNYITVTL